MCIYWKKLHTCGHTSDRPYIEMCRPGCLSNTVCSTISTESSSDTIDTLRASHFPCYPCIKAEVRAEAEERYTRAEAASRAEQFQRVEQVQRAEQVLRAERVRKEAREKAAKEREEEKRARDMREREDEVAKREGGAWIESSGGKKGKGKRGGAVGFPVMPHSGLKAGGEKETDKKENVGEGKAKDDGSGGDKGGRAGTWGPKRILSRKEGIGQMQGQAMGLGQMGKK